MDWQMACHVGLTTEPALALHLMDYLGTQYNAYQETTPVISNAQLDANWQDPHQSGRTPEHGMTWATGPNTSRYFKHRHCLFCIHKPEHLSVPPAESRFAYESSPSHPAKPHTGNCFPADRPTKPARSLFSVASLHGAWLKAHPAPRDARRPSSAKPGSSGRLLLSSIHRARRARGWQPLDSSRKFCGACSSRPV
ncbi:hypothetical protein BT67DRAFT_307080 [Trichocladium antarcticum]|uniref:Uncharacterized protein n=1 Tax=Trichocladium antarcticum TaxID=1450529 RepID=A0AAN6UJC1_9PEZI|nr:hypothetical protein BT67DRAFT_307080 [Trichocladium antarcticum]